jgi:transglutaminase-like putative cysteine protease
VTRRAVGTVVVSSWLVCMAWLVVRQFRQPQEAFLEAATIRLAPGAAFYQIVLNGTPMGSAGITLDTTLTGYRLTEVWTMDLAGEKLPSRHVLRSEAILSRSLKLQKQTLALSEARVPRNVDVEQQDSAVTFMIRRPGSRADGVDRLDARATTIPAALPFRLAAERRLEAGGLVSQIAVLPLSQVTELQSARVVDNAFLAVSDSAVWDSADSAWRAVPPTTVSAWRLERLWNGMRVTEWVNGQGQLLRRSWAFGLSLERTPFELNYNSYQSGLRRGTIKLPRQVPGARARSTLPQAPDTSVREVVLYVARSDGPAWPGSSSVFSGGRQSIAGDTVTIRKQPADPDSSPDAGHSPGEVQDHQLLRDAFTEAMAGTAQTGDTVTGLVRWVHRAIRLSPDDNGADAALGAAGSRIATADGKVQLLVQLLRRAGMPARAVAGVDVGQPELPGHAWVEVWRGDRWTAVDPVFGQVPAAATLLRVAQGANSRPLTLVPLVASLRTTTLTTRR